MTGGLRRRTRGEFSVKRAPRRDPVAGLAALPSRQLGVQFLQRADAQRFLVLQRLGGSHGAGPGRGVGLSLIHI